MYDSKLAQESIASTTWSSKNVDDKFTAETTFVVEIQ